MQVVLKEKRVSIFKHLSHSGIFTHQGRDRIKCVFLGKAWDAGERQQRQPLPPYQFEESRQSSPRGVYLPRFIHEQRSSLSLGMSELVPKSGNSNFLNQLHRGQKHQASASPTHPDRARGPCGECFPAVAKGGGAPVRAATRLQLTCVAQSLLSKCDCGIY